MDFIQFYEMFFFLANIYVMQKQSRPVPVIFWGMMLELPPLGRIMNVW